MNFDGGQARDSCLYYSQSLSPLEWLPVFSLGKPHCGCCSRHAGTHGGGSRVTPLLLWNGSHCHQYACICQEWRSHSEFDCIIHACPCSDPWKHSCKNQDCLSPKPCVPPPSPFPSLTSYFSLNSSSSSFPLLFHLSSSSSSSTTSPLLPPPPFSSLSNPSPPPLLFLFLPVLLHLPLLSLPPLLFLLLTFYRWPASPAMVVSTPSRATSFRRWVWM